MENNSDPIARKSSFLSLFWDLASEDKVKRLTAASHIVSHVEACETSIGVSGTNSSDTDYTLKRLIRGLGSSREAARQGFATCLCEILRLQSVNLGNYFLLLDDCTKVTGSMKGSEERDMLFGKLFGYIALIRSGRLQNEKNSDSAISVFNRMMELHAKRGWIREVIAETILELLEAVQCSIISGILSMLKSLLIEQSPEEMAAWHLMFALGLQCLVVNFPAESKPLLTLIPECYSFSVESLPSLTPVLMASTAGFPKIHRVWEYLLGSIFGMTRDRKLIHNRLESLSQKQEQLLSALTDFIDTKLLRFSHEKRGVAMRLTTDIIRLCPAEYIPVTLSKSVVRSLLSARINKKNTLYNLAGSTIHNMVKATESDPSCRLALASAFVHHGGANFDSLTGTNAVSGLLEGLNEESIVSHVKFICSSIELSVVSSDGQAEDDSGNTLELDASTSSSRGIISAIEALSSMAKNVRIANRTYVYDVTLGVLIRLSCFESSSGMLTKSITAGSSHKTPKKSSKKKHSEVADGTLSLKDAALAKTIEAVNMVEESLKNIGANLVGTQQERVIEVAKVKLLALLADSGAVAQSAQSSSGSEAPVAVPSFLQSSLSLLHHMAVISKLPLIKNTSDDVGGSQMELIKHVVTIVKRLTDVIPEKSAVDDRSLKLAGPFTNLIILALFQSLTSDEVDSKVVEDLVAAALDIIFHEKPPSAANSDSDDDEDDDDSEESNGLQLLLDACLELLSLPPDHSVKGIRESVKRVWSSVVHLYGSFLSSGNHGVSAVGEASKAFAGVIDAVVEAVIGDDGDDDDEEGDHKDEREEEDDEEGDEEEDVEDSASEDHDSELPIKNGKNSKNVLGKGTVVKLDSTAAKAKATSAEEEEEDDIMIDEDAMLDMLNIDCDGSDDDGDAKGLKNMVLEHSADADGALAELIKLKKQQRKQGLLSAKRREYLVRSRAIDILEIIVNRCENGMILFSLVRPLMICLKKTLGSSTVLSLAEGRAFEQRLRQLLEQKIAKKRIHITVVDSDDADEVGSDAVTVNDVEDILSLLSKGLNSSVLPLRHVSLQFFLTFVKALGIAGCDPKGKVLLFALLKELFATYASKKRSKVPAKLFDEIVVRQVDVTAECLLGELIAASTAGKTSFVRSEAFRLLGELLKRYKACATSSHVLIASQVPKMVGAVLSTLRSAVADSPSPAASGKLTTKHLKGVLTFAKDLTTFAKVAVPTAHKSAKIAGELATLLPDLKQILSSKEYRSQLVSPVVAKLSDGVILSIDSFVNSAPTASSGNGKATEGGVAHEKRKMSNSNANSSSDSKRSNDGLSSRAMIKIDEKESKRRKKQQS